MPDSDSQVWKDALVECVAKRKNLEDEVAELRESRANLLQQIIDLGHERNGLEEQYQSLHAAALALLESADDQTHPDDGFPIEEWLNLVDAVRGSNPASEPEADDA